MSLVDIIKKICNKLRKNYILRYKKMPDLFSFGDKYDGYLFCIDNLNDSSVVYSFGIGEDLEFSEVIIKELNCNVYAFDPTPKSINYVHNHKLFNDGRFNFYPVGLADYDGVAQFHLPKNDDYVSGSIDRWDGVKNKSIEVDVKKLKTIMNELGHKKIDLLKMDIEGTEFSIIGDIVNSNIDVRQICVEVHDRFYSDGSNRLIEMREKLKMAGFSLVGRNHDNLTFLKCT